VSKPDVPYSDEIALKLCERLAGGESLLKICATEGMPARSTIYSWLKANSSFQVMYLAAREEHADSEFERLDQLVNETPPTDDKGRIDMGWVQNQRLKVDALKWKLARMSPRKYSERIEITGADGEAFVPKPDELTPDRILEGARRLAFILRQADQTLRQGARVPLQLVHDVES
jgi:hypothetical protein